MMMRKLSVITILLMIGFLLFSCAEKAEEQAQVTALQEQNAELQKKIEEMTKQKEAPAVAGAEPVTINWWFAHGGRLGEKVQSIVANFNAMQSKYKVIATYKGNYTDTMNAGIAGFRSKNPPHILQVFEVGTATMMAAKGAIKPVYEVMARIRTALEF